MRWVDRGIPVAFGTEDYDHDMWDLMREIRQCQMTRARLVGGADGMLSDSRRTAKPSFYELLERATRLGAEAIGMGGEVGSIEEGKRADIITVDMRSPYLTPTREPLSSVYLYATPGDVSDVVCDGRS